MSEVPALAYVRLEKRTAMLVDGRQCPIVAMFDFEGDYTDDWAEASRIVVKVHEEAWMTVRLSLFDPVVVH